MADQITLYFRQTHFTISSIPHDHSSLANPASSFTMPTSYAYVTEYIPDVQTQISLQWDWPLQTKRNSTILLGLLALLQDIYPPRLLFHLDQCTAKDTESAPCNCQHPQPFMIHDNEERKVEDLPDKYGLIITIRFSYVPSFKFASICCKMQVKPDETESVYFYATQRSSSETQLIKNWFNGMNYRTLYVPLDLFPSYLQPT